MRDYCQHCRFFSMNEDPKNAIADSTEEPHIIMHAECRKRAPSVNSSGSGFASVNTREWCGEFERYKAPNRLDNVIDAMGGEDAEEGETHIVPHKEGFGERLLKRFGGHQMRWTADVGFRFLRRPGNGR